MPLQVRHVRRAHRWTSPYLEDNPFASLTPTVVLDGDNIVAQVHQVRYVPLLLKADDMFRLVRRLAQGDADVAAARKLLADFNQEMTKTLG